MCAHPSAYVKQRASKAHSSCAIKSGNDGMGGNECGTEPKWSRFAGDNRALLSYHKIDRRNFSSDTSPSGKTIKPTLGVHRNRNQSKQRKPIHINTWYFVIHSIWRENDCLPSTNLFTWTFTSCASFFTSFLFLCVCVKRPRLVCFSDDTDGSKWNGGCL